MPSSQRRAPTARRAWCVCSSAAPARSAGAAKADALPRLGDAQAPRKGVFQRPGGESRVSNLHERAAPLISLLYTTPGDRVAAKRFVGALCAAISEQVAAVGILRPPGAPPSSVIAFGPDASRTGAAAELGVLTESGGGI